MKICVTATERNLDASVDPFLGRCRYFVIVDPETMEFEVLENPGASARGGAGVRAAQAVANKGIDVMLTGDIGPNALPVLSNAGIKVVTGVRGTVREVIEQYKTDALQETAFPTTPPYSRMGRGRGYFAGYRGVPGRGYRHFGFGRGFWCRWYPHPDPYYTPEPYIPYEVPWPEPSREGEIAYLEETLESLEDELQDIKDRLRKLSKKSA